MWNRFHWRLCQVGKHLLHLPYHLQLTPGCYRALVISIISRGPANDHSILHYTTLDCSIPRHNRSGKHIYTCHRSMEDTWIFQKCIAFVQLLSTVSKRRVCSSPIWSIDCCFIKAWTATASTSLFFRFMSSSVNIEYDEHSYIHWLYMRIVSEQSRVVSLDNINVGKCR